MEEMQENLFVEVKDEKKGFGVAGVVLGAISILCCFFMGFGISFALVGIVFSIIAVVKGTGSAKTLGIVGIILNGIGLLLNAYMIVSFIMVVNWNSVNMENLNRINEIDPNDKQAIQEWLQQFFKTDISSLL